MQNNNSIKALNGVMSRYSAVVIYAPQKGEVDINNPFAPLFKPSKIVVLPTDKKSNPFVWAEKCGVEFAGLNVYVLVPGRMFDLRGTRHGRGGGWFDRFLSAVPSNWLRIGATASSNVSPVDLTRKEWDQPVDWLLINDGLNWSAYETKARSIITGDKRKNPR